MYVPSILRRSVLRTFSPLARKPFVPLQKQSYHRVPPLKHENKFTADGIPGLFTPTAFDIAWVKYQGSLVAKLSALTAGMDQDSLNWYFACDYSKRATENMHRFDKSGAIGHELGQKTAFEIAILTSRQADLAATFNYASQAYNNHFFFDALSPSETEIPEKLLAYIPDTFSSVEAMKTELLTTAEAMFGAGWVWLVLDMNKRFRILCTYNAGTPYGLAHRRQDTDMNTGQKPGSVDYTAAIANAARPRGTQDFIPLVNINCWEHAWLTDFGITGKSEYLESWWKRVDWDVVVTRLGSMALRPTTELF